MLPKQKLKFHIHSGDFQNKKNLNAVKKAAIALVNPPRSGLKDFLHSLTEDIQPSSLIYISCFPESFAEDSQKLSEKGYHLEEIKILDQFPQTHHYEIMALFQKKDGLSP
jgi:23S rRNA (uracil1939-C5)-methyltransferase